MGGWFVGWLGRRRIKMLRAGALRRPEKESLAAGWMHAWSCLVWSGLKILPDPSAIARQEDGTWTSLHHALILPS